MAAKQRPNPRQALQDLLGDETQLLFADGHDDAIVGFSERDSVVLVVYDVRNILRLLRVRDGMSRVEAQEFFDFNIAGSWVGEQTPVWLFRAGR
jgi:hypothetical protein